MVLPALSNAPDAATIKLQGDSAAKGTAAALAAANAVSVTGLAPDTEYKAYVIVEDAQENISDVAVIDITTLADNQAPVGTNQTASAIENCIICA